MEKLTNPIKLRLGNKKIFIILFVWLIYFTFLALISDKIGTKVVLIAVLIRPVINPVVSGNKNASVSIPAQFAAIKVSRINPRNLLPRVNIIIINIADFATFFS